MPKKRTIVILLPESRGQVSSLHVRSVYDCLQIPYFAYQRMFQSMDHPDKDFMIRHGIESESEEEVFFRQLRDTGVKIVV